MLDRLLFGVSHIKQTQQQLTLLEVLATVLNALHTQIHLIPPHTLTEWALVLFLFHIQMRKQTHREVKCLTTSFLLDLPVQLRGAD